MYFINQIIKTFKISNMKKIFNIKAPKLIISKLAKLSNNSSFSLLEMALTLTVIGIIGGIFVPAAKHFYALQKINKINEYQKTVIAAIKAFTIANNRLPTPQGFDYKNITAGVLIGAVPVQKLGLPPEVANYFIYIVDSRYACQSYRTKSLEDTYSTCHRFLEPQKPSLINIIDCYSNTLCHTHDNPVIIVLKKRINTAKNTSNDNHLIFSQCVPNITLAHNNHNLWWCTLRVFASHHLDIMHVPKIPKSTNIMHVDYVASQDIAPKTNPGTKPKQPKAIQHTVTSDHDDLESSDDVVW